MAFITNFTHNYTFNIVLFICLLYAVLKFTVPRFVQGAIDNYFKNKNTAYAASLNWDYKIREQAARVAEYLAIATSLTEDDSSENYRKVNQQAWELLMWLPIEICQILGKAIKEPNESINPHTIINQVRKILLREKAGNLSIDFFIRHAPGIGKKQYCQPHKL